MWRLNPELDSDKMGNTRNLGVGYEDSVTGQPYGLLFINGDFGMTLDNGSVAIYRECLSRFIARLESLRSLAEEHFGEDWGK